MGKVLKALDSGENALLESPTGSGKSTITRLLTREYGGVTGDIQLNGKPLTAYCRDELGRLIAVVHQNVFLFHGTIAENIALGRTDIDRTTIEAAAKHGRKFIGIELDEGYFNIAKGRIEEAFDVGIQEFFDW